MKTLKEQSKISQWGHSKAARIPSQVIAQLGLKDNQALTVTIENNAIVLTPTEEKASDIHELFANWQDDHQRDQELDWGESQGNELPW
ncbi:AbrB/MazE/SpoVT family DNA-binding domain-containing protein [Oenococcus kitaharae]|uniref:AbrB/MazE/SpoVT family DNA-binding domain-containing protein n=1 Tax=Oenococcus TaxID=46254 RepID=UPI0021E9255E|nr:AbrB/MazE/SpoVT family DNA-binding domain-containing protein [Oenococcus kitaharae]MCV3295988.1 PbsX family transcriptional regulator [Oenococcus kitaharae]